jgi:hypothetical protein
MEWVGDEKTKRTMGSPKGWKRAAEWMRKAEWKGTVDQDWKEAVEGCTGVTEAEGYKWDNEEESIEERQKWEIDESDSIYTMLKQFKEEKGKMDEGCYGPKPAGLKHLRRIQARWACKNTVELIRHAIEFSEVAKKRTIPESVVCAEHEYGEESSGHVEGNLQATEIRVQMPEARTEQAVRPATNIAAKESSSIGGKGEDICVRRGTQTPRVSDRIMEREKSESVPRGRGEEREGRARTRRRGSPIMMRKRQREGVTEEGVGTQSKKSGGTLRSTEMRQTARSEDRVVTRKTAALQGNTRECDRRTTRSSARKDDGDGAVT